jgi:hypothetical protein
MYGKNDSIPWKLTLLVQEEYCVNDIASYLDVYLKMPYFFNGKLKGANMKEILIFLGFVAGWIVLMKYVLPKLGIST